MLKQKDSITGKLPVGIFNPSKINMFTGRDEILLQIYFDLKNEVSDLKTRQVYNSHNETINTRIKEIEKDILEIISIYDKEHLIEIIMKSLDVNEFGY